MDIDALWLTLKLAGATTLVLLVVGLPLAWWLATTRRRWRFLVEAVVAMPLVLPPTVLGFGLLMAGGPRSWAGARWLEWTGAPLPFSFAGILTASVLFNLPFAVRPFLSGFLTVPRDLLEAAACLGARPGRAFWRVAVPMARPGIVSGMVLTFAHTMGEFGVVLMVGGSIPGVTRTLSIALYEDVQALDYASATRTAAVLLGVAFTALAAVAWLDRERLRRR
jgi:molybdate transport system permease protein